MTEQHREIESPKILDSSSVLSELAGPESFKRSVLGTGFLSPEVTAQAPFAERLAERAAVLELAAELFKDRLPIHLESQLAKLPKMEEMLALFKEPYRQRIIDCIEKIASPSAEILHENGRFLRRAARLLQHPKIASKVSSILDEEYWLSLPGFSYGSKTLDMMNCSFHQHPALEAHFFPAPGQLAADYSQALTLLALTDPKLEKLLAEVPLPEESGEQDELQRRAKIRAKLESDQAYTFGDAGVRHFNQFGFGGDVLFTQRVLDRLGFRGQLEVLRGDRSRQFEIFREGFSYQTAGELKLAAEAGNEAAGRAFRALYEASRKNGFHVIGDFYENSIYELFGLDDRISWEMESQLSSPEKSHYGSNSVRCKLSALPGAYILLTDEVMLNWKSRPSDIALFQRVMLSREQFEELILDNASVQDDGTVKVERPNFVGYGMTDSRWEVQTRGCLSLS